MKHYARVYHMLVCHGHSGTHAMNIILAASRRDDFYMRWIRRVHTSQPRTVWINRYRLANPLAALTSMIR